MDNKKKSKPVKNKVGKSTPIKGKAKKALTILSSTNTEIKKPSDVMDIFKKYEIPADSKIFNKLVISDKIKMMEHVVDSIEFAHKHNLDLIEVFQYQGTNFVVTISKNTYYENLKQIYDFYIKNEYYELCIRIKQLENELLLESKLTESKII